MLRVLPVEVISSQLLIVGTPLQDVVCNHQKAVTYRQRAPASALSS